MKTLVTGILLFAVVTSCQVVSYVYDDDPVYSTRTYVRPIIPQPRYSPGTMYYPWPEYYSFNPWIYRERVIIVQPNQTPPNVNYGKRPSRELGNYNREFKPERGRRN